MNFINLTPHAITIIVDGGENIIVPASGTIARCAMENTVVGNINGIDVVETVYGDIEGLPAPQEGVAYLVSGLIMSALAGSGRVDVFKPESFVRNEEGNIIGCRQLTRL